MYKLPLTYSTTLIIDWECFLHSAHREELAKLGYRHGIRLALSYLSCSKVVVVVAAMIMIQYTTSTSISSSAPYSSLVVH